MQPNPHDVIHYWLGEAEKDPAAARERSRLWYGSSKTIDNEIRDRFGDTLNKAVQGELQPWLQSPEGQLAVVILLDQFSRNLNRGSRDAWKNDDRALDIATACVDSNNHLGLSYIGRVFLYHPFHHAESVDAQERAVLLFDELHDNAPPEWQPALKGFMDFTRRHCEIVRRFGRFPHRNDTLGRQSTPAEDDYLKENNRKYGQ